MSSMFRTREEARDCGIRMAGRDPATTDVTVDPNLTVVPAWVPLGAVDDPDYERRKAEATANQVGYRFVNSLGTRVGIVTDTFRDGYCCWGVLPNGAAVRF